MPKPMFPHTPAGRFARRLWQAMDSAGWAERGRQARLVRKFGVSQPTAHAWVHGAHMPEADRIRDLADELGCSFEALRWGVAGGVSEGHPKPPPGADEVPIWDAQAAAGIGRSNESARPIGSLLFRERSLRRKGITAPHAMYVSGHSMVPRLRDGDTVIFDSADTKIRSGKVYVIDLDGEALVKRLHLEPGDVIRVASDNRSDPQYQDLLIPAASDRLCVAGRVRWVGSWED